MEDAECCTHFWYLRMTGARSKPCQMDWGQHIDSCIAPPAPQMPCFSRFSNRCLNTVLAGRAWSGYAPNSQALWKSCPTQLQLPERAHLRMPCCLLTEKPYLSPFPVMLVGTQGMYLSENSTFACFCQSSPASFLIHSPSDKLFFLHSGGRKTKMQMPDTWSNLETSKDGLHI